MRSSMYQVPGKRDAVQHTSDRSRSIVDHPDRIYIDSHCKIFVQESHPTDPPTRRSTDPNGILIDRADNTLDGYVCPKDLHRLLCRTSMQ